MNSNPLDLRRVDWRDGLFLKPDHFQRQDGFAESLALWNTRYGTALFGLIGAGPRIGADPTDAFTFSRVNVAVTDGVTSAAVERVRGVTPAGAWIDRMVVLRADIPTLDVDTEALLYVVRRRADGGFAVKADDGAAGDGLELADAAYELTTRPAADDAPWALVVGRLKRRGEKVERDDSFIPSCAFVSSHVALREETAALNDRIAALENVYVVLHGRLREIAALARRAAVQMSDDYDDMLHAVHTLAGALGDGALVLRDGTISVQMFVDALDRLAARTERTLRLAPSFDAALKRADLTVAWSEIRKATGGPLRADENLADRVGAGRRLVDVLEGIRARVAEKCDDYRVVRRYEDLQLAIDRKGEIGPKELYERVTDPQPFKMLGGQDIGFDFLKLNPTLDHDRSYIAVLFAANASPGSERDYVADVSVNGQESRQVGLGTRIRGMTNLSVPIKDSPENLRDVKVRIQGGGPFSAAALYVLSTAQTTYVVRSKAPGIVDIPLEPYVVLNLTGHREDREGKIALASSREVRLRINYDRPSEKGGKGSRRRFEIYVTKGQVWHLSLVESKDARIVCRWNEDDSLMGIKPTYDFSELPKSVDVGLSDPVKGPKWFLKCRLKFDREVRDGKPEEIFRAKLTDVAPFWPLD